MTRHQLIASFRQDLPSRCNVSKTASHPIFDISTSWVCWKTYYCWTQEKVSRNASFTRFYASVAENCQPKGNIVKSIQCWINSITALLRYQAIVSVARLQGEEHFKMAREYLRAICNQLSSKWGSRRITSIINVEHGINYRGILVQTYAEAANV
jgi:hypothetical protein